MGTPNRDDVWFCMHLYEQRRDPLLREARDWMNNFAPKKFSEVEAVMTGKTGPEDNRCWRQAMSYWEMISALMLSGGVSEEARNLFVQTTREFFFHFSKIAPFLDQIRAATRPAAFQNLEKFCGSLPDFDQLMAYFTKTNDMIRARNGKKPRAAAKKKRSRK